MTYEEYFKSKLPADIAEKAIKNLKGDALSFLPHETDEDIKLSNSFHWGSTPEGHDYWQQIQKQYNA